MTGPEPESGNAQVSWSWFRKCLRNQLLRTAGLVTRQQGCQSMAIGVSMFQPGSNCSSGRRSRAL